MSCYGLQQMAYRTNGEEGLMDERTVDGVLGFQASLGLLPTKKEKSKGGKQQKSAPPP